MSCLIGNHDQDNILYDHDLNDNDGEPAQNIHVYMIMMHDNDDDIHYSFFSFRNPLHVNPIEIEEINVLATVFRGKVNRMD